MKKRVIIGILLLIAVIAVFRGKLKEDKGELKEIKVGEKSLLVEYAKTPEEREQGLSDRKSLCDDCGLLFVFDKPDIYPFWMKRMNFDIDIIWIDSDRIVDITEGAKKPSVEEFDRPKTIYTSKSPVDKVLEVNAGWVNKGGIKVGDKIEF